MRVGLALVAAPHCSIANRLAPGAASLHAIASLRLRYENPCHPPLLVRSVSPHVATAIAQEGVSRPVGFTSCRRFPPASRARSRFPSTPTPQSARHLGEIDRGRPEHYLENAAANWTPEPFPARRRRKLVRFTSGAESGRSLPITTPANAATRLYIADDGVGLPTTGLTTGDTGTVSKSSPATPRRRSSARRRPPTRSCRKGRPIRSGRHHRGVGRRGVVELYYNTAWQRWTRDTDLISDPSRDSFLLRSDRGIMIAAAARRWK